MTGNPNYGLAQSFAKLYPNTTFVSRSTSPKFDLRTEEEQRRCAELSCEFPVFINNSYISHFSQLELCRQVWTEWKKRGKTGFIINIGSSVRDLIRPDNRFYPTSKRALEDYSRQLHLYSVWGDSKIRVSCVNFGGIATEGTLEKWPHYSHMQTDYCASVLDWVLKVPENINLDLLQITPIQPKTRRELKKTVHLPAAPSDYLIADFDESEAEK